MKKCLQIAGILSAFLTATTVPAKSDGAGYRMCNKTGQSLAVSFIFRDGFGIYSDSWRWSGYYVLRNGRCDYIMPTHSAMEAFFSFKEVTSSGLAGSDIDAGKRRFRSSNRSAEAVNQQYCNYSGNNSASIPLSAHRSCGNGDSTGLYSIFWRGFGQKHHEVRDYPHTLTIE
ncbi:MAG: DUF1036 domain-containing protein [Pseudomonadota bacterium]